MVTPATMVVNLVDKASGWKPVICSHEELINLVKKFFIEGQSEEFLNQVEKVSKGGFWSEFLLTTPNDRYRIYAESAAFSKGRLVTIRDNEKKIIYEKDYLFLKKFAIAVIEECEKERKNSTKQVCYCPECGTKCDMSDTFCGECGNLLKEKEKNEEEE